MTTTDRDRDTPVPHEPIRPGVARPAMLLTLGAWTLVAAITALLWLAGGWWMVLIGWLLIVGLGGLLLGSVVR